MLRKLSEYTKQKIEFRSNRKEAKHWYYPLFELFDFM